MSIITNKIIIVSGYLIILGVMAVAMLQRFNVLELIRFTLFWVFLTALVYPAFRNTKDINESPNKDNDDFFQC